MSSCTNCGSCRQFTKGPSGNCDYCDCAYADHLPGGASTTPVKPAAPPAVQPFSPQREAMPFHQAMSPLSQHGMQYGQHFMAGQHYVPTQPMYSPPNPMMGTQFNPGMFDPQPIPMAFPPQPHFGGMQGMPMALPNQMTRIGVVSKSCTKCGAIFPETGPPNKLNLCSTCAKSSPATVCSNCKTNPANPGFTWCQQCFDGDSKCHKCGKNPPNEGYGWCESCYQNQQPQNPIDCPPLDCMPSLAVVAPGESCPSCGNKKFYDMKKKGFFDFCGQTCATQHYTKYGVLKLERSNEDYQRIELKFQEKWNPSKGACPVLTAILKVSPKGADTKLIAYMKTLRHDNVNFVEYYFHGCKITCDLLNTNSLCNLPDCTICLVSKLGFDISKVGTNVSYTRFGKGLYFAPESSKCHDYTLGVQQFGYRAMFYVKCAPGFKQVSFVDNNNRTAADKGYDSLYGLAGGNLNYDELCLYNDSACVPEYILIYSKDGVDRRCF